MDARTAVYTHSVDKYTRLLEHRPDVARTLYEASKPAGQPAWYTLDTHGNVIVNKDEILQWAQSRDFDKYALAYYTDRVLSPQEHKEIIDRELGLPTQLHAEDVNPWLDANEPLPEQTMLTWDSYAPTFMSQRITNYPVVAYAANRGVSGQIEQDILILPPTVRESLISSVTRTLPTLTSISGTIPYPLSVMLGAWMRQKREHHAAIIALALVFYQSQPTLEDETDRLVWAARSGYMAYTVYTHELLRTYPHLILILRDTRTLEQIQMESTWLHETMVALSTHPVYSTAVPVAFDWHFAVSPNLLDAAGVDVEALGNRRLLKYLINSADHPDLLPHVIAQMPTYRLLGVTYTASHTQLLLTHQDQVAYQRLPRGMSLREHPVDLDYEYPQGDPYRTLKCTLPVRQIVLQELGEIAMNPMYHGQQPTPPQWQSQPQYPQPPQFAAPPAAPAGKHTRMPINVSAVFLPGGYMPLPPEQLDAALNNQVTWSQSGQYLELQLPDRRRIQIILRSWSMTQQGIALTVVAVNPLEDANLRNLYGGQGGGLVEVPPALLPGIVPNAPGAQYQPNTAFVNAQMAAFAPASGLTGQQQGQTFGQVQQGPRTLQELMTCPLGTTMEFDGYRYTRTTSPSGFMREALQQQAPAAAPVTPRAMPLATPAPAPTPPVPQALTAQGELLVNAILAEEATYASSNDGQVDPVVFRHNGESVYLSQALRDPGYYNQTHRGLAAVQPPRSTQAQRWQGYFAKMIASTRPTAQAAAAEPPAPAIKNAADGVIEKLIRARQEGHTPLQAQPPVQPAPVLDLSTLDKPEDDFSITDDGVDKLTSKVITQAIDEVETPAPTPAPAAKPVAKHREVPVVAGRARRFAIVAPAPRRSGKIVVRLDDNDALVGMSEVPLQAGDPVVQYTSVPDLLQDTGRATVAAVITEQIKRDRPLIAGVDVKLSFSLTNADTGEPVEDVDLMENAGNCETIADLRALYEVEGLTANVSLEVVENSDRPTQMCESLQEMAAAMVLDAPGDSSIITVPAMYACAFTLAQVQGQPAISSVAAAMLDDGVVDASTFIERYNAAVNTEHTKDALVTCGSIPAASHNAVMLRAAFEELNTTITRRMNYAFKHLLGIDLRLINYVNQQQEILTTLKQHYGQGGLPHCWPELESQVLMHTLSNLIHVQPTEDINHKHSVLVQHVNMVRLACTLDDLDITLIPGADARAQPARPGAVLRAVLSTLEKEYMPNMEFCAPHAPSMLIQHVLVTLDGRFITAYPHPGGITTGEGDTVWMLTLQE
jgi:hypothetical protein